MSKEINIIQAVYNINPIYLSTMCNTPNFNKIVEKTIDKIIYSDYLKYWNIHNVFKKYDWYNDKLYVVKEDGYITNNYEINIILSDKYCLNMLKLKRLNIDNIVYMFANHIWLNSNYNFDICYDIIKECLINKKSFTTVVKKIENPVYNRYLCTKYPSRISENIIKVFNETCDMYNDVVIVCQ